MYKENITVEELAEHELSWFKGEIVVIDDLKTFYRVFPRLKDSELLGFDTETRPTFKKGRKNPVSLIQLSTEDLACLIRINKIGIPDELVSLLSDPSVVKAGVAVHDDIRFLKGVRKFEPEGFIDLQNFVKDFGIQSSGLKKLAAIILGFRISKRQQVTDWEAEQLTEAQQVYAATDAWVCYEIFKKLTNGQELEKERGGDWETERRRDEETKGQRDEGTKRRRDEETERGEGVKRSGKFEQISFHGHQSIANNQIKWWKELK